MRSGRFVLVQAFGLAALLSFPGSAATILLGINGDAQIGSNYIDFGQYPNGAPYTPAPGYGSFEISLVNAGVFNSAGVTTGEFGIIQSLNEGTGPITLPSAFMTFDSGGSNLQLWATNISSGGAGPFVLSQTANGAVASFAIEGYIVDINTGTQISVFSGTFSATFGGQTVASLFTNLPIDTPFSATFTDAVLPIVTQEPGYAGFTAAALLAAVSIYRVRNRRLGT